MQYSTIDRYDWKKFYHVLGDVRFRLAAHYSCTDPLFGPSHFHDRLFQITHLINGAATVRIGPVTYQARRGDTLWIPPKVIHESIDEPDTTLELIEIKFSIPGIPDLLPVPGIPSRISPEDLPDIATTLERIVEARSIEAPDQGWLSRTRLGELLILLVDSPPRPDNYDGPLSDIERKIRQTEKYIMLHYAEDLSIAALAKNVGMSESHFATRFREITREKPWEHIIQRRLHHAKELLSMTTLPIAQIAGRCGFGSSQYFSRMFRQRENTAPSVYRTEHRESKNSATFSGHTS